MDEVYVARFTERSAVRSSPHGLRLTASRSCPTSRSVATPIPPSSSWSASICSTGSGCTQPTTASSPNPAPTSCATSSAHPCCSCGVTTETSGRSTTRAAIAAGPSCAIRVARRGCSLSVPLVEVRPRGRLARVPDERDFVGLDRSERGLIPVRCEQWGGW